MMNQYETVFIMTPVLSEEQMKETVEKFKGILTAEGAEIINEEKANLESNKKIIEKMQEDIKALNSEIRKIEST